MTQQHQRTILLILRTSVVCTLLTANVIGTIEHGQSPLLFQKGALQRQAYSQTRSETVQWSISVASRHRDEYPGLAYGYLSPYMSSRWKGIGIGEIEDLAETKGPHW